MIKIQVKRKPAWQSDIMTAPVVWAFIGNAKKYEPIFREVTKLTESKHTKEHNGKFYFNNVEHWWYVKDKEAADLAVKKINEQEKSEVAKLYWNI